MFGEYSSTRNLAVMLREARTRPRPGASPQECLGLHPGAGTAGPRSMASAPACSSPQVKLQSSDHCQTLLCMSQILNLIRLGTGQPGAAGSPWRSLKPLCVCSSWEQESPRPPPWRFIVLWLALLRACCSLDPETVWASLRTAETGKLCSCVCFHVRNCVRST